MKFYEGSGAMKTVRRKKGMAMLITMISVIVIATTLTLVMVRMQEAKVGTDSAVDMIQVEEAAQAGISSAIKFLWNDYITTAGNTTMNWASYRTWLDNNTQIKKNEDLNFNGTQDTNETGDGRNGFEKLPATYDRKGWPMTGFPMNFTDPSTSRVLGTINWVYIARYDDPWASYLTVRSNATVNGKSKTAVQVLEIGSREASHTAFAILANNINCILCHAQFLQNDLERNTTAANYGSYDRVKIAALESLLVRSSESADSAVAGTIYTRGTVIKDSPYGQAYTASQLASAGFKGYQFSNVNGKITQSSTGAKTQTSLSNATTNAQGDLNSFSNLYMNYPTALDDQTDGEVPTNFPAPFEDTNANRTVDDTEFQVITSTANGAIDFRYGQDGAPAGVKAGVAYGLRSGQLYAGASLPTASNTGTESELATGKYDGNLMLIGTSSDPIVINKSVAINGDLLIAGPVKGEGLLNVKGNVYIAGDVTYADATGQFGKADDGTENALAIQAGGNIMMGDYLTIRGVNHSANNGSKFPDWTKYSIDTRQASVSANITATVGGVSKTETLPYGYKDAYSNDQGQVTAGKPGQQVSFTQAELMLFNKMELNKAIADTNYVPRFYGLRESQPSNIYLYMSTTDEHTVKYDDTGVYTLASYITAKGLPSNILTRAKYQYLNPKSNWLPESTLRNIWWDDEQTRPSSYRDFKFDGLLYSNNAIFTITRSETRHKSKTNGKMTIRGGIIAQDLGMFIPGAGSGTGLNMLYDPRVERFLTPHDPNVVALKREAFYYE